ncbi:MAG TPA: hypothetical protein VFR37_10750 [Longimicrobium sp.]|nr:hypothetical protein [Longimicrobium sp.]
MNPAPAVFNPNPAGAIKVSAPPPLPPFDSRETPGGGRLYVVENDVHLVAYFVGDPDTVPGAGEVGGLYLYAFLRGERVGHWAHATDAAEIRSAMEAFAELRRGADRTGGEDVRPVLRTALLDCVAGTLPAAHLLDLPALLAGEPQPEPRPVIPLPVRSGT